jgi:crotonobetainyl-CoA:carnitine CoA-transferase CaiB-like acyl-CoA transferase
MLGQDTDAILADLLGLDENRIAALRADGTVA